MAKVISTLPAAVWVVVPAFNESTYIQRVIAKIAQYTDHIIVVDDGSTDDTAALAQTAGAVVIRHRINLGKGAALKTGCDYAINHCQAGALIVLDGDDQHDPAILPTFARQLERHPVVFGVRDLNQMPWLRTIGNRLGSLLVWLLFGRYLVDIPSGYKGFSTATYDQLRWDSSGYSVEMEIAARVAQYRIPVVAVPIPTIYHDFNRGMTVLDTFVMIGYLLNWRVTL